MPEEVLTLLFNHVDPLYEHHTLLLKDMEHRLAAWYAQCDGRSIVNLAYPFVRSFPGRVDRTQSREGMLTGSVICCSR